MQPYEYNPLPSIDMPSLRFENAIKLRDLGHLEEAAHEFHVIADLASCSDEKAGALINEHECYCQMGKLDEAQEVMHQIRALPVQDEFVRMVVEYGEACMSLAMGKYKEGILKLEEILDLYREELQNADARYLYEEIQQRRGFTLTTIERYAAAIPVLKEATTFNNVSIEDMQSLWFYLGVCYAAVSKKGLAKEAYLRSIGFRMSNATEADARYRIAVVYFTEQAFAQAKYHLEMALQLPEEAFSPQLRKFVYHQMSRICHYLGDTEEEKKYLSLSNIS